MKNNGIRLHLPAIPYTITRDEYSHDAYTGKVMRFAPMMRSRGFEVYHYGVETSQSGADKDFELMTKAEWNKLRIESIMYLSPKLTLEEATKKNTDPTMIISELSNWSTPLANEFNRRFREKLLENYRGRQTDIVCLPLGRMHEDGVKGVTCLAVETGIGYSGSFQDFRIFESHNWMSRTLGIEKRLPHNYWFVVPNYFDTEAFKLTLKPLNTPKRIGFLGRITSLKGCGIFAEIAARFPAVQFILCGGGDPSGFLKTPNIIYKPPIHGEERSEYLGGCDAVLCLSKYLEPFCGVAVEAQLCGTPVICSDWGGMVETVEQYKTGLRGRTVADYCHGVQMALDGRFDRAYIRQRAARMFDMYRLSHDYEYIFKTMLEVYAPGKNGWYSPDSYIENIAEEAVALPNPTYPRYLPGINTNIRLHVLAVPYTITSDEYSHDAFTDRVRLLSPMMRSRGFEVYHYGIEGSQSGANMNFDLLTKAEWTDLRIKTLQFIDPSLSLEDATLKNEDQSMIVNHLSNFNSPLTKEFNRRFRLKLQENYRSTATDIVCLPLPLTYQEGLAGLGYVVTEIGIGYEGSHYNFRIFDSYTWMSKTLGGEDKQPNNYWFVIPHPCDLDEFKLSLTPNPLKVGFLGRIINLKGCGIIKEVAKRFPHVQFILCGQGDPKPFSDTPNVIYKPPIHGRERSDYLGECVAFIHPVKYLEPFGCGPVEAQLCGTPVICSDWGGMTETVEQGKTGLRCHTLADFCYGVQMALDGKFDRSYIRERAASKYDMYRIAYDYEYAFKTILEVSTPGKNGWYSPDSHIPLVEDVSPSPRIYIFIPYYGAFPNYFQLYLDSLGKNADILSVILITDIDTSPYKLPENLLLYKMPKSAVQARAAKFIQEVYGKSVQPEDLLKDNYKFVDFKIVLPILFDDVLKGRCVGPEDFVGWGDIDLIYGNLANFIKFEEGFGIIGGWHGHFAAIQNTAEFKYNFKGIPNYLDLITDNSKTFITDEIAYREPLKKFLADRRIKMCYINASFCDIVPPCFYHMSRPDHAKRAKNFYDVYNSTKDIDHVYYDKGTGVLTVKYDDGSNREASYCHLQKRKMSLPFTEYETGYCINEHGFSMKTEIPLKIWQTWITMDLPPGMKKCVDTLKSQNPEFEHRIFDDEGCRNFIMEYFPKEVLAAYDAIIPGAYKADLWRYCVLYIHGGIYIDTKLQFESGFKLYSLVNEEHFVSDGVFKLNGFDYPNLYNGFMVCKKGSPILLNSIIQIVYNVSTKYLGPNPWMPTGPGLLRINYIRSNNNSPITLYHYDSKICRESNKEAISTHYPTYKTEQKASGVPKYSELWKEGTIYRDLEIDLQGIYMNKIWPVELHVVLGEILELNISSSSITKKKENIVIVSGHYPADKYFARQTRRTVEKYCSTHSYGFYYDSDVCTDTRMHILHYRRCQSILKASKKFPDAQWFLWLDSDVYVNRLDLTLESQIDLTDLNIQYHLFHEKIVGFCYPINTGVKFVNKSALHYEEEIWNNRDTEPWCQFPFEQKAIYEYVLPQIPDQCIIHDPYVLNCLYKGLPDKIKDAIFVHMCSNTTSERTQIVRDFLLRSPDYSPESELRIEFGTENTRIDVTGVLLDHCRDTGGFLYIPMSPPERDALFSDPILGSFKSIYIHAKDEVYKFGSDTDVCIDLKEERITANGRNIYYAESKNIVGYIHVCQIGDWKRSFNMLIDSLKSSKLYENTSRIRIGVLSEGPVDMGLFSDPKYEIVYKGKPAEYERPTLLHMHSSASKDSPNTVYYYLHTKGIRHFGTDKEAGVIDWINLLLYWNVEKWEDALKKLRAHDTYGCNLINHYGNLHYSGNFWWATSAHIKKLPRYINASYNGPEYWICTIRDNDRQYCAHNSGMGALGHYLNRYPLEKYADVLTYNVILKGHFRTFEQTYKSWEKCLAGCSKAMYLHAWDTVDSDTKTWHYNKESIESNTNPLTQTQTDLLRSLDPECVIEAQEFTEEEKVDIVLTQPYKTFLYFWQGINSALARIQKESKYIFIGRYDISVNIDFKGVTCEEDEILIGYTYYKFPLAHKPFIYGWTDIIFMINYKDKHKLMQVPQTILDLQKGKNPDYLWAEDPITDFFNKNWKKVTPKWIGFTDFDIVRATMT